MRRVILLLIVAIGLAPGTWWRSAPPPYDGGQELQIVPLDVEWQSIGRMQLVGAWELRSSSSHFHGYSALAALDAGTLLALSDRGRMLRFSAPGRGGGPPRLGWFSVTTKGDEKRLADIEAMTRDSATGRLWAAYEGSNLIERRDPDGGVRQVQPEATREWSDNSGPEAMVRLADGRFIVLSEGSARWNENGSPGLLFPSDPLEGAKPLRFRFAPPSNSRAVDMAQLPDGRVLILTRSIEWGLPPGFSSKLVLADPTDIVAGGEWIGTVVGEIAEPLPSENYEGLAVSPGAEGETIVWLISDDNASIFQRTLLLELRWRPNEKARGTSRAPLIRQ